MQYYHMTFPQTEQNEKIHSDLLYELLLGMQLGLHLQGYLPSQHKAHVHAMELLINSPMYLDR